jgi:hypothetical protein
LLGRVQLGNIVWVKLILFVDLDGGRCHDLLRERVKLLAGVEAQFLSIGRKTGADSCVRHAVAEASLVLRSIL